MQSTYAARLGPLAMALVVLGLMAMPVPAHARDRVAAPSAGWHGRAIKDPRPRPQLVRASWPQGWSAGSVRLGTGYHRPGGSKRVREVQRRLVQLGYRPGPVDGLFGPRTRASTRWFQYKHGLRVSGRVNRSTLTVLRARSDHEPLPTARREARNPVEKAATPVPPTATPVPPTGPGEVAADGIGVTWLVAGLLILLALVLGLLVSQLLPDLRRLRRTPERAPAESPPPAPAPAPTPHRRPAPPGTAPRVLGYAVVDAESDEADTATAALALRCAQRGWSLVEVIRDQPEPGRALAERPGLTHALDTIRARAAAGLVVARLRDFTGRAIDLATLVSWLDEADAFLGAADHELDTSTKTGRGTAGAITELGRWERRRITERPRKAPTRGRFTPAGGATRPDLSYEIAAMHEHGLSFRAIADALNLVGIPGPPHHGRWETADVKAAVEERTRTRRLS